LHRGRSPRPRWEGKPLNESATILIVDDEPAGRDTLSALLQGQGYRLVCACGGAEALQQTGELSPDLILLDVMMPGMDGFSACRALKSQEDSRHIPIILVTALDSKEDLVRGLDAGADEFLSKPVGLFELRARVRSMLRIKRQYDELRAAVRLREEMANMIVHDMRSPLTAILGYVEFLRRDVARRSRHDDLEAIADQARRLNALATDLLLLAKMQSGKLVLHLATVDIAELVRSVAINHTLAARARDVRVVVDAPAKACPLHLDSSLFERVVDNLLSNGLKFAPTGSTVTVRVRHAPRRDVSVSLQVLDEGPGVPPEYRTRIFDQFEVIAMRREGLEQVGLGLAFCRMVVEAHGGRISVSDNAPSGAVFTVELFGE
jgi:two-component system sensor histidine kinase/response regulator